MIFGMTTANYTAVHVLLSLVGIASGLVALWGMFRGKMLEGITTIFLVATVLTSITGFGFPFDHLLPAHKVGIISLVVLAIAIPARYMFHLAGVWRVLQAWRQSNQATGVRGSARLLWDTAGRPLASAALDAVATRPWHARLRRRLLGERPAWVAPDPAIRD